MIVALVLVFYFHNKHINILEISLAICHLQLRFIYMMSACDI